MTSPAEFYEARSGYHAHQMVVPPEAFHWIARARTRKLQPFVEPAWDVVEYGCGTGLDLAMLRCARRAGHDVATHLASEIAARGIEFFESFDAVPAKSFDVVLCHHVLEHVPQPLATLTDLKRPLKPGGRLVLVVPHERERRFRRFRADDIDHHLYAWSAQALGNLVTLAGYAVERVELGQYGSERWSALHALRWNLGETGFRSLLATARTLRSAEEIRLVARLTG